MRIIKVGGILYYDYNMEPQNPILIIKALTVLQLPLFGFCPLRPRLKPGPTKKIQGPNPKPYSNHEGPNIN